MDKQTIFAIEKEALAQFAFNLYSFIELNHTNLSEFQRKDILNTIKAGFETQVNLLDPNKEDVND